MDMILFLDVEKPIAANSGEDKEFPNQTRNTFIAAVFGLTALVTYVLLRGVISINIETDSDIE